LEKSGITPKSPTDYGTDPKILTTWVTGSYQHHAQAKFLGDADFFLVAFAAAHGHIVVTHETPSNGQDVKIPNACKMMDVRHMNPFEMLSIEKVTFHLPP